MKYPYMDSSLPVDERVADLMSRMTLNQKVRQITGVLFMWRIEEEAFSDGIGEFILYLQLPPAELAEKYRQVQDMIMNQTQWRIPAIIHAEAIAGLTVPGCAVFPTSISLGATFAPELVRDMADRIREQMVNYGVRHAMSPNLDLIRDFRWGRTAESYSSDPTHVTMFSCAYVEGLQGDDLRKGVAATPKHFIGYSQTEGGVNCAKTLIDPLDLRMHFAKPFEAVIRNSKAKTIMNSYSEYNGQAICSSKAILSDLLRDELGFDGMIVSDYTSIKLLHTNKMQAETPAEAGIMGLKAGIDLELPSAYGYWPHIREAVKNGEIAESYVNRSVEKILKLKFELGLFEEPYKEFALPDNSEHDKQSSFISDKVMTLTKNDGILPIKNQNAKIAVIGPSGEWIRMLQSGYSHPAFFETMLEIERTQESGMVGVDVSATEITKVKEKVDIDLSCEVDKLIKREHPGVLSTFDAIKELFPNTVYVQGCHVKKKDEYDFEAAKLAAEGADYVIMTVGGKVGSTGGCTNGEGMDDVDIGLPGMQTELIKEVFSVNKQMIVVHSNNKPLVNPFVYENVPAILEVWLPGPFGGNAIARVIAGITNPGGRLPVDVPRHLGQTPIYHYQQNGSRSDVRERNLNKNGYLSSEFSAQLPFGYGLSYTTFEYSNGELKTHEVDGSPYITVAIDVENTGEYDGDEVVQLYGADEVGSIIRPQNELIGFLRVTLKKGKKKRIQFDFRLDQFAFPNADGEWVIEKGSFYFYIGKAANMPVYETHYQQEKTLNIDYRKRGFFADVKEV